MPKLQKRNRPTKPAHHQEADRTRRSGAPSPEPRPPPDVPSAKPGEGDKRDPDPEAVAGSGSQSQPEAGATSGCGGEDGREEPCPRGSTGKSLTLTLYCPNCTRNKHEFLYLSASCALSKRIVTAPPKGHPA
ncbi:hypothetical protein DL770_005147 [Monosporascus sp. CRB-9-2]|nr:hypothetical protein DL770_005147 [Monosporascus sp. CRB-9-2]